MLRHLDLYGAVIIDPKWDMDGGADPVEADIIGLGQIDGRFDLLKGHHQIGKGRFEYYEAFDIIRLFQKLAGFTGPDNTVWQGAQKNMHLGTLRGFSSCRFCELLQVMQVRKEGI